ncbi:MAG: hypothetical protein LAO20_04230 [Acidobacteriia bacterium]|nr:hypothetical protein [Terriglobia bacterium]
MTHTLLPLSLGKLLDETFNIYRRNFLLFIGISAVPNLVLLLLQLVVTLPAAGDQKLETFVTGLGIVGTLVASMFAGAIVTAATTFGVSDVYLDRPTSMVACFARVWAKALRVLYVSFVVGLIVGFGAMLCIVPGIYWAGVYGIAVPAVVLENITGNESLKRSSSLTSDSVGRVIVVYFLTTIFAAGMSFALDAGVTALSSKVFHVAATFAPQALSQISTAVGEILFGPVSASALTLVYYDQRVRKEAFDIQHMMALMSAPNNMDAGNTAL